LIVDYVLILEIWFLSENILKLIVDYAFGLQFKIFLNRGIQVHILCVSITGYTNILQVNHQNKMSKTKVCTGIIQAYLHTW